MKLIQKDKSCQGRKPYGNWGETLPCTHQGSILEDGAWYCKLHVPSLVKTRREAAQSRADVAYDARRTADVQAAAKYAEEKRRASLFPELVAAAEDMIYALRNYGRDAPVTELARLKDLVAKAKGEAENASEPS